MVNMGTKLKDLRIEKKLTQAQVAEIIGVAPSAISSYESGLRYPTYESLIRFARLFHVSTDFLLGVSDQRSVSTKGLSEDAVIILDRLVEMLRK